MVELVAAYKEKQQRLLTIEKIVFSCCSSGGTNTISDLLNLVDNSLQKNDLTMSGFQPGKNNDTRLRLSDVPYESLVQ
jgi:hypothetical protein